MHEWALAEAVVSAAVEVAKRERFKEITEINIKIGELQQIDVDIFKFALKEITLPEAQLIKMANIKIDKEPAILSCNVCGNKWSFGSAIKELSEEEAESIHFIPEVAHAYIRCTKCKSPDFDILNGRGVWIAEIKGLVSDLNT